MGCCWGASEKWAHVAAAAVVGRCFHLAAKFQQPIPEVVVAEVAARANEADWQVRHRHRAAQADPAADLGIGAWTSEL